MSKAYPSRAAARLLVTSCVLAAAGAALSGCVVYSVASTGVKAAADVVGTTVDVTTDVVGGTVGLVTGGGGGDDDDKDKDDDKDGDSDEEDE